MLVCVMERNEDQDRRWCAGCQAFMEWLEWVPDALSIGRSDRARENSEKIA